MNWSVEDIPDQQGRLIIITGATSGIGYEAALALAGAGAEVVLTGRSDAKGEAALRNIRLRYPNALMRYMHLDLSSLDSVKKFSENFASTHSHLDLLINNAGVMMPPRRYLTSDGFELQFGTNYLSHFALTARLLPLLMQATRPHVVTVSSGAHRLQADIHFDDLQWERNYKPWPAYAQSKLATLLFARELQRRSDANGWGLMSNAAHPGYARTGLQSSGPRLGREGDRITLMDRLASVLEPFASQSAAEGALPTLYAATAPQAEPGSYYGPQNFFELKGPVGPAIVGKKARDPQLARRLWDVSVAMSGVHWAST